MHVYMYSFIIASSLIAHISSLVANAENGRQLFLMSSSRAPGYGFLRSSEEDILNFCERNRISRILFVPYAVRDHNKYNAVVTKALNGFTSKNFPAGLEVTGLHECIDKFQAVATAECILVGGGNTFLLLKALYDFNLVDLIRERVFSGHLSYMGWSAGANVATTSIQTTNDMPIVFPTTFEALNLVPFNINPHFPKDTASVEKIKKKLKEFHQWNITPVLALRDGAALRVNGDRAELVGIANAVLFRKDLTPTEIEPHTDLSFLLTWKKKLLLLLLLSQGSSTV